MYIYILSANTFFFQDFFLNDREKGVNSLGKGKQTNKNSSDFLSKQKAYVIFNDPLFGKLLTDMLNALQHTCKLCTGQCITLKTKFKPQRWFN